MRPNTRSILSCAAIAAYAIVALPGPALHEFLPGHGLHDGMNVVECATHHHSGDSDCVSHQHVHHGCEHHTASASDVDGVRVQAQHCDLQSHACGICEYVALARSLPPQALRLTAGSHVVDETRCPAILTYLASSLGPQAPRAPPALES
jgi:hypothetical protein